ncbi:MAG: protein kinase, partial [Pirellulaceae bacterium]|nr:protein kinase [Pirellulaceae bacterium]
MSQEFPQAPDGNRQESNLSGAVLGDFLLLRLLGRGGMAEVYLAEQQSLRRQVAFKILRRDLAEDPQYVQRFHQEARAAARLVQANIVQIYEVGKSDGLHYIAQEYVKGQNLKQYLHRHGAVDSLLAVNIMRQVASALVKAAENRVTHRDIKPENILLATNGEVKVADFGLARVVAEGQKNHLTQVGITMGTPLYMSPEQVEGKAVDPRSDLYSFGVTCYEMLAGRPPFEGETPLNVAVQHLKKEADPLNQIRPDVPAQLCEMIGTLMNKSPEERYESAAALLKDLRSVQVDEADERWLETLQQLDGAETSTMTSQLASTQQLDVLMKQESTALKLPSRSRWLAGVAILCVFAFLTGCGVAFLRQPPDLLQVNSAAGRGIPIQKSVEGQLRYA